MPARAAWHRAPPPAPRSRAGPGSPCRRQRRPGHRRAPERSCSEARRGGCDGLALEKVLRRWLLGPALHCRAAPPDRLPLEVVLLEEPRPLGPDEQARRGHERRVKKRHERRQLRHLRAAAEKRRPIDLVVRVFEVDLEHKVASLLEQDADPVDHDRDSARDSYRHLLRREHVRHRRGHAGCDRGEDGPQGNLAHRHWPHVRPTPGLHVGLRDRLLDERQQRGDRGGAVEPGRRLQCFRPRVCQQGVDRPDSVVRRSEVAHDSPSLSDLHPGGAISRAPR
mmetsp:Transcript_25382/g.76761  ORF Transcript_25382/g.76761 Transcript_25382/m.76761 type:complete len:280 (-) Transcript_25382:543-1382(-)